MWPKSSRANLWRHSCSQYFASVAQAWHYTFQLSWGPLAIAMAKQRQGYHSSSLLASSLPYLWLDHVWAEVMMIHQPWPLVTMGKYSSVKICRYIYTLQWFNPDNVDCNLHVWKTRVYFFNIEYVGYAIFEEWRRKSFNIFPNWRLSTHAGQWSLRANYYNQISRGWSRGHPCAVISYPSLNFINAE